MNLTGYLEIVSLTDVGQQREHNEDSIACDGESGLVVLADGMGGYKAGEVASGIATLTVLTEIKSALARWVSGRQDEVSGLQAESRLLRDAVAIANEAIYNVSQSQPQCAGMGTTLVLGLFVNDRILVGHIGDSRMYRLRDEVLMQLTEDHSLLQEQIRAGVITAAQAAVSPNKHLVTRALGIEAEVELELHEYDVSPGDIYLLCSDGLSDMVDDDNIHLTLNTLSANLGLAAHQLIQMANDHGGRDNISVILVRVLKPFPVHRGWPQKLATWLNLR